MNFKLIKVFIGVIVLGVCVMSGCKESADSFLNVNGVEWRLVHLVSGGDDVYLRLSGTCSGERVTVKTFGDGLINEQELTLNANHQFSAEVVIAFSHERYNTPVQFETTLKAYKNGDSEEILLSSGNLN